MSIDVVVADAADALANALKTGRAIEPLGSMLEPYGIPGAYAVQDELTRRSLASGRRLIGRKIGLTSISVQNQLGVDQPDYGMLFADMEIAEHQDVEFGRFISPRVEAEVAFVLHRDLDDADVTLGKLVQAIDFALPAIEIVDSRIAEWNISILDTVADNASSAAYVLGGAPVKLDRLDLRLCGMVLEHKGEPVSAGCGAACLGNPLAAALWLARTMAKVGRPLGAGDVILAGALGPMVAVSAGSAYQARINGLGSVNVRFGTSQ